MSIKSHYKGHFQPIALGSKKRNLSITPVNLFGRSLADMYKSRGDNVQKMWVRSAGCG